MIPAVAATVVRASIGPMQTTRLLAVLAVTACFALAGCGRTLVLNYSKAKADDAEVIADKQALQKTDGVENVIVNQERSGRVTIELYVDADDEAAAAKKALELGYDRIR